MDKGGVHDLRFGDRDNGVVVGDGEILGCLQHFGHIIQHVENTPLVVHWM